MSYTKPWTIDIPKKRGIDLGTYLFERFLQFFWTDEEITLYIRDWQLKDKTSYMERVINPKVWVIATKEYTEFLNSIIDNLPKKYRKKSAKKFLATIDLYMWPKTIEQSQITQDEST